MNRKIKSTVIAGIMLLAMAAIITPITAAVPITCTIRGYVYVDEVITPPDEVKLIISDQEVTAIIPGDPVGYYILDFDEDIGETGTFDVTVYGKMLTAAETITIQSGVYLYKINLTVDTTSGGVDIELPSKVTGLIVTDAKDGKLDLSWDAATDNVGVDRYNIYWDQNGYSLVATVNDPTTQHRGLNNDQTYTYKVSAVDAANNEGPRSNQASGIPTASGSSDDGNDDNTNGGGTNGGGTNGGSDNDDTRPNADASLSDKFGFTGLPVSFDGSKSTGSGSLTYTWDFGDENTGTGKITTHTYTAIGEYTVTLTVSDGANIDTNTTKVIITELSNLPPTAPTVTGDQTGTKNTEYSYTAVSTDDDNDTLQYMFHFGDTSDLIWDATLEFLPNGTAATINHSWSTWGIYTIKVKAYDNKTYSGTTEYVVLIDVLYVKDIGYLIDENSNGTYGSFYSNETKEKITVEKQDDETYLINSDGDGEWNYIYDPDTNTLTSYSPEQETSEGDNTWYMLGAGMIIVILLVVGISIVTKKKKK